MTYCIASHCNVDFGISLFAAPTMLDHIIWALRKTLINSQEAPLDDDAKLTALFSLANALFHGCTDGNYSALFLTRLEQLASLGPIDNSKLDPSSFTSENQVSSWIWKSSSGRTSDFQTIPFLGVGSWFGLSQITSTQNSPSQTNKNSPNTSVSSQHQSSSPLNPSTVNSQIDIFQQLNESLTPQLIEQQISTLFNPPITIPQSRIEEALLLYILVLQLGQLKMIQFPAVVEYHKKHNSLDLLDPLPTIFDRIAFILFSNKEYSVALLLYSHAINCLGSSPLSQPSSPDLFPLTGGPYLYLQYAHSLYSSGKYIDCFQILSQLLHSHQVRFQPFLSSNSASVRVSLDIFNIMMFRTTVGMQLFLNPMHDSDSPAECILSEIFLPGKLDLIFFPISIPIPPDSTPKFLLDAIGFLLDNKMHNTCYPLCFLVGASFLQIHLKYQTESTLAHWSPTGSDSNITGSPEVTSFVDSKTLEIYLENAHFWLDCAANILSSHYDQLGRVAVHSPTLYFLSQYYLIVNKPKIALQYAVVAQRSSRYVSETSRLFCAPSFSQYSILLAKCLVSINRHHQALDVILKAFRKEPDSIDLALSAAFFYRNFHTRKWSLHHQMLWSLNPLHSNIPSFLSNITYSYSKKVHLSQIYSIGQVSTEFWNTYFSYFQNALNNWCRLHIHWIPKSSPTKQLNKTSKPQMLWFPRFVPFGNISWASPHSSRYQNAIHRLVEIYSNLLEALFLFTFTVKHPSASQILIKTAILSLDNFGHTLKSFDSSFLPTSSTLRPIDILMNQFQGIFAQLEKVCLATRPDASAETLYHRGLLYLDDHDLEEAGSHFLQVLAKLF